MQESDIDWESPGAFVRIDDQPWLPMSEQQQKGGIEWKLLFARPGSSRWTVMYRGPAESEIMPHIHAGEAEGWLFYGKITTSTAEHAASGEGFILEPAHAHHPLTRLLEDTCFILTMDGPIRWLQEDGTELVQTPQNAVAEWERQKAARLANG